ncbi:VP7 [Epizootic hemorrhagic disease virus 2]|uniref:Core protein VP7 n=1 Tax=Epizootic hemorrhagic disease virus 2 TaxID=33721 RepID=A0A0A7M6B6_9REOV|nr:VP7 [Epizootic hemorrhagic disease virus 2]
MDTIAARALTVIKACNTLKEVRIVVESNVLEILGIAINRYNGLTLRSVTMRPTSQEQRNEMFFMCLDMTLAAANLNIGNISPDYIQNLATIGVLATPEIPYTMESANEIARMSGETGTWGPDRQPFGYFLTAAEVTQHGRFRQRAGQNITTTVVSSTLAQVSMNAGARGDIQALFQNQNDPIMIYFVWRRIGTFSSAAGNAQETPQGVTLNVGGVNMRAGVIVAYDGQAPVNVNNPGAGPGMIEIEVIYYLSLDKTMTQYPSLQAQIFNVYSYKNPLWHGLRAAILNRTTLPNNIPPIYPPNDRENVLLLILLSALADAFSVLAPDFNLFGVVPIQGPINRAVAQNAYV